jgi:hypothetical protein
MKKNKMSGVCSRRVALRALVGSPDGKTQQEDLGVEGKLIKICSKCRMGRHGLD